jgi:hypothetical protein
VDFEVYGRLYRLNVKFIDYVKRRPSLHAVKLRLFSNFSWLPSNYLQMPKYRACSCPETSLNSIMLYKCRY